MKSSAPNRLIKSIASTVTPCTLITQILNPPDFDYPDFDYPDFEYPDIESPDFESPRI